MSKLHASAHIVKILRAHGFILVSQQGSHSKYRKTAGDTRTVIVPANKREIPIGTFRSIARQSGLAPEDF